MLLKHKSYFVKNILVDKIHYNNYKSSLLLKIVIINYFILYFNLKYNICLVQFLQLLCKKK